MNLKLKTISPVILSPRIENALYKGVDFKEINGAADDLGIKDIANVKVVYPFYSHESRDLLSIFNFSYAKEYYIPASTLKGALLGYKKNGKQDSIRRKVFFQDIKISNSYIKLKNLYKFQYLYQKTEEINGGNIHSEYKIPKLEPFFPRVVIEMMESNIIFDCEVLLRKSEEMEFSSKIKENFCITKNKLYNYVKETENRINDIKSWIKDGKIKEQTNIECINKLEKIKFNIQAEIDSDKNIIFMGGYKGLIASLSKFNETQEIKNGFYIDYSTLLPYGLVEVVEV
ncbi:hypothetical protein [Peptostreptococcus sp. D1]|uniref:hypothetical protein n=1 Tax=Peptostreptococcus sp. D1 TaxID=72304 RepID=UPI0008EB50C3|nr:hypothetical protein [Peptostreptococcus sp. D1]SFE78524.1 hypothetical protein SAMN02910278_01701 [Peptostreptococcus sp. D1]